MKWTDKEIKYLFDYTDRTLFLRFHWPTVAKTINYYMGFSSKNRSPSACRHKYYQLKRKQLVEDLKALPTNELNKLLQEVLLR